MDQRGRCRLVFSVFSFFQFFVSGGYEELVNKWSTHSRSSKSICMQSLFYSVLPLKCYAAQAVAKHLVEFPQALPSELPRSIRSFIHLH